MEDRPPNPRKLGPAKPQSLCAIGAILEPARALAVRYYELTGKPLGLTGEVGEYEAAKRLQLTLLDARNPGYDATDTAGRRIQIKTRCFPASKAFTGQRIGIIKRDHECDAVLLVLLDELLRLRAIYEAPWSAIATELQRAGSKARERGALAVTAFVKLARKRWPSPPGSDASQQS
jgi:hypothetical protein